MKLNVKEVGVVLNKEGKAHDNAITTWHKGVLREIGQQKDQEEYEALAKCHGSTIQRIPTP